MPLSVPGNIVLIDRFFVGASIGGQKNRRGNQGKIRDLDQGSAFECFLTTTEFRFFITDKKARSRAFFPFEFPHGSATEDRS
ncbi:MAG: hypothetical protein ISN28_11680 [Ectothiorhodospiraceae bacterium AqS1]|nr:hypothetical protein [Ectothiorhodospiraceae bacterium AqS1]